MRNVRRFNHVAIHVKEHALRAAIQGSMLRVMNHVQDSLSVVIRVLVFVENFAHLASRSVH